MPYTKTDPPQTKYSFMLSNSLVKEFNSKVPKGLRASVLRGMVQICIDALNRDNQMLLELMAQDPDCEMKLPKKTLDLVRRGEGGAYP